MTRLYKIFNGNEGKHGEPFGMCDDHYNAWTSRGFPRGDHLLVEKIADDTTLPCNHCERERVECGRLEQEA